MWQWQLLFLPLFFSNGWSMREPYQALSLLQAYYSCIQAYFVSLWNWKVLQWDQPYRILGDLDASSCLFFLQEEVCLVQSCTRRLLSCSLTLGLTLSRRTLDHNGLLLMISYSVYDVYEQAVAAFHSFMEKQEVRHRSFCRAWREEGSSSRSRGGAARIRQLQNLVHGTEGYPVDLETGEIGEPEIEASACWGSCPPDLSTKYEEGYSED